MLAQATVTPSPRLFPPRQGLRYRTSNPAADSNVSKPPPLSTANRTARYNSMIRTHVEAGRPEQALSLFRRLLLLSDHPLSPDSFTLSLLLKACAHLSSLQLARQIHSLLLKSPSIPTLDLFVCSSLLSAYAHCGHLSDALLLFDRMPHRNVVTWNSLLSGFLKCGLTGSAVACFDRMPARNIVSWNSLLSGYVRAGMPDEALLLFLDLRLSSGLTPDESTMAALVSAASGLGMLGLGRIAHGYVTRSGLSLDGALGVALIAMYSRCGSIDHACGAFSAIRSKNVGHWTSMIGELANHGLAAASLRLFSEMLRSGVRPNHVTFIGVLNACRHAGLAEEGMECFGLMGSFDVEPRIEHYGCLVDLLGRCGLVEAAAEMACSLPMDPGFVVWSTLLAACGIHGNVEIAETAAKKLIELRPEDGSPYVLLSNLYAKVGRWEDFRRTRKMMEESNVVRVTGFSWIEVDGRVHEFVAGDQYHARAKEIHGILEEMKMNLRWTGYQSVPSASRSTGAVGEEEGVIY